MLTGPENLQRAFDLQSEAEREELVGHSQLLLAQAQLHATYALINATLESKPADEQISESWYDVTKW